MDADRSPRSMDRSAVRRVAGNSAWLIFAEGGARIASLATIVYLSRTLAPEGMGAVQFGLAVFASLQAVSIGGVEALLTPEAARRPRELAHLAGRSLLIGWSTFAVAFGLVVAGTWVLGMSPVMRWSAAGFGFAAVLVPVTLRFAFIGRERAPVVAIGVITGHLAFLGLCVASVHEPDDVGRVALCWTAAIALRAGGQLASFAREHGAPRFETDGFAAALRRSTTLGAGSLARGLVKSVDVLVLGLLRPADEVAHYALAVKLPLFAVSLTTLFYVALIPTLARAATADDPRRFERIGVQTLEAVLGATLPGALCLWIAADPLVVMLFSERFRDAAPLLALLVWRIPLEAAIGCLRTSLWARRPEADSRVAMQTLVLTVALLLALGGRGAPGIAAAMLAADVAALGLHLGAGGMAVLARVPAAAFGRIAAGAAVAIALTWALPRGVDAVTVAGALAAWAVAAAVADAPYVRRLVREVVGRATP
jgi:O-antigen/teichoic acid export membrane protein